MRKLYEVFKGDGGNWKIQFPKGVLTVPTKKEAQKISMQMLGIDRCITPEKA